MSNKFRPLKKEERKTILLLSDDLRVHSGVGNMAREIVLNSVHHFNFINLGAAVKHPDEGKVFDLSSETSKISGVEDASVLLIPSSGYGDAERIRSLLNQYNPDAIMIFTDPRYWVWLFKIEREIRTKIPIVYLSIWDDYPAPMYNRNYYRSVDALLAISKQTHNIHKLVLGDEHKSKVLRYVPHGVDKEVFYPITKEHPHYEKFILFKKQVLKNKDIEFCILFNSRNIRRKNPGDVILSYRMFCDLIGDEKAKKTALIMHTSVVDENGTDLLAVKNALCKKGIHNVFFSSERLDANQMNLLYNIADVSTLISSNEGWGLSLTESLLAGKMFVANVTGGMQDQMRFEKEDGSWIDFDENFPSNHRGTVKKHGPWVEPVFPSALSLIGSPPTPYIYDDRCRPEDVAQALLKVYELSPEEREERGLKGREWAISEEAGFTSEIMGQRVISAIDDTLESFVPRKPYEIVKVEDLPDQYVNHKLFNYTV